MKKSRIILVATCILVLLSIIITQHFLTPNVQPHTSVEYYKIAEQHEQDKQWRKARSAWLRVKAEADSISQNTSEANGRQAYCDYRIAMTYHNEGNNELAIASLKLALATPASDINQFMGHNGTTEMQKDLMEVVNAIKSTPEKYADKLANQLAISKYSENVSKTEEYKIEVQIARQAYDQLKQMGPSAFPSLCKHLNDDRNGISFRAVSSATVGDASFDIMTSQLYNYPTSYTCSMVRIGGDGEYHTRPYFGKITLFQKSNLQSWLDQRKNKSLPQLQAEILKHVIDQERKIGFKNKEDEAVYLTPLLDHIETLSSISVE